MLTQCKNREPTLTFAFAQKLLHTVHSQKQKKVEELNNEKKNWPDIAYCSLMRIMLFLSAFSLFLIKIYVINSCVCAQNRPVTLQLRNMCMHAYIHKLAQFAHAEDYSIIIQWSLMVHSLRTNLIYHYCLTLNRLYDFMYTHIIHAYRYIWSTHNNNNNIQNCQNLIIFIWLL